MYFLFEKLILFWSKKTFLKKNKEQKQALKRQKKTFDFLIKKGKSTLFGKSHCFSKIKNYSDFKKLVPLRSYEDFSFYINKISFGEKNVLWPRMTVLRIVNCFYMGRNPA